jgi:Xaa-Pro aminopeptidase
MQRTISIENSEYAARVERLQSAMQELAIDAVLIGTGMNLQYFSGFHSPPKSVVRPYFLLISARRRPVFFTHIAFAAECRRLACVEDIRSYETLSTVPVDLIADALYEAGSLLPRVGMELGFEQSLDISPMEFSRLQKALSGIELVDASSMLWNLRMIKSEVEIECIRQACDFVDRAYAHTFRSFQPGMNERDIFRIMQDSLHKSEGDDTFLVITSGEGNYDLISKPPDDRTVLRGDMVWMDAGCRVQGYWSDYSRGATFGNPSDLQKEAQEMIHKVTLDTVAQIRPGMRCSEIAKYALSRLEHIPFPITSSLSLLAGRVGHGVGLTMTEPPHLGLHDDTILQPGMVVSIEPGVATRYGAFHVEENIAVRENGTELLSKSPRTLVRLGADA